MARNNANYSPFLPTVEATARQNQTINNPRSETRGGTVDRASGVTANNYSAGLALSWRLFDGLDMFATRERLLQLEAIGELALQQEIEKLVIEVCSLYYNIVAQQYRLAAARRTLELSAERYEDAQFRHRIGKISGLEARQAIVDLHADSSSYVLQEERLKNTYITLDNVMNVDLQLDGYIRDTITMNPPPDPDDLQRETLANNKLLHVARREQRLSVLDYKKTRALLLPTLDFNSGYNYTHAANPSTATRANGPYWGFAVNIPIFNRTQTRTRLQNARLDIENKEWSYQETEKELLADLALLYNAYESNLLMLDFEQEGAAVAATNLDEAMTMYKLGALSGIDFRQFQQSYINAIDRKLSAMYQAKMS
jgi:outer membrane protein TolC